MTSTNRRSLLFKLLLILGSGVLSLVIAEGVLRLITREKVKLQGMYSPDEIIGATLTPGFHGVAETSEFRYEVDINELGMRDIPLGPKKEGASRVLVLGDSFVFGVGVSLEDSITKELEKALNEKAGFDSFEAFNGGQPGTATFHHLNLLRRLAPEIEPDLVVLIFFVGDDWFGNWPRRPPQEARRTPKGWLRANSVLFRYFERIVLTRFRKSSPYEIHRLQPAPEFLQSMDRVLGLLAEIREVAGTFGAPVLIAVNPKYSQVYDGAWSKASFVYGLSSESHSIYEPNNRFLAQLEERGLWHVDLLQPLRERALEHELHFSIDGHWNSDGHAFVSSILAEEILERRRKEISVHD